MFGDKRFTEDLGLTSNNWGWSLHLGDLVEGVRSVVDPIYTKPIYARTAQGVITKGYIVGYIDIFWNGIEVTCEFDFEDDVVVVDPKVWVGNTALPLFKGVMTNAPGKLVIPEGFDYSGDLFIAIHFEAYVPCMYPHPMEQLPPS